MTLLNASLWEMASGKTPTWRRVGWLAHVGVLLASICSLVSSQIKGKTILNLIDALSYMFALQMKALQPLPCFDDASSLCDRKKHDNCVVLVNDTGSFSLQRSLRHIIVILITFSVK